MKSFAWMYFLIGVAHGVGVLEAQQHEMAWWEASAIVVGVGTIWPVVMALNVEDNLRVLKVKQ